MAHGARAAAEAQPHRPLMRACRPPNARSLPGRCCSHPPCTTGRAPGSACPPALRMQERGRADPKGPPASCGPTGKHREKKRGRGMRLRRGVDRLGALLRVAEGWPLWSMMGTLAAPWGHTAAGMRRPGPAVLKAWISAPLLCFTFASSGGPLAGGCACVVVSISDRTWQQPHITGRGDSFSNPSHQHHANAGSHGEQHGEWA